MHFHVQRLINDIFADEPDPAAANALQEGLLGGSPAYHGKKTDPLDHPGAKGATTLGAEIEMAEVTNTYGPMNPSATDKRTGAGKK